MPSRPSMSDDVRYSCSDRCEFITRDSNVTQVCHPFHFFPFNLAVAVHTCLSVHHLLYANTTLTSLTVDVTGYESLKSIITPLRGNGRPHRCLSYAHHLLTSRLRDRRVWSDLEVGSQEESKSLAVLIAPMIHLQDESLGLVMSHNHDCTLIPKAKAKAKEENSMLLCCFHSIIHIYAKTTLQIGNCSSSYSSWLPLIVISSVYAMAGRKMAKTEVSLHHTFKMNFLLSQPPFFIDTHKNTGVLKLKNLLATQNR
jgi:hypothetical protein